MKVSLISFTPDAAALMIFTKATRLDMSPGLLQEIKDHCSDPEWMQNELKYMAGTIPSSWEFVDYVFLVEGVSRAYTHQQVRTRSASYAQQSMRVVGMDEFEYVFTDRNRADERAMSILDTALGAVKIAYRQLRDLGQPAEDARGILPTNIATNIVCKFNLRTFVELAKSRTGGRTQGEYQKVVNAMVDEVLKVHPWVEHFLFAKGRDYFADIEAWALKTFPDDLLKRGEVLKIVDKMRKEA